MDRQAVGTAWPPASWGDSHLKWEQGSTQGPSPEPEVGAGVTRLPAWPGPDPRGWPPGSLTLPSPAPETRLLFLRQSLSGVPSRSSDEDSEVSLPGTWVQSLVRKLRSHKPFSQKKQTKKTLLVMNYHFKKGFRFYKL